jgi:hypothetical protein
MAFFGKNKKDDEVKENAATAAAEEEAPKISMTKGGQEAPVQDKKPGANSKQFTGPQAELMKKIESIAKAMYEGKRDCYLILDPRTTLEELEKGERLRPMISPLNQQRPLPVIRIATGSIVAEQVARNYNCVNGDTALVAKIPFANIFTLLNNLMVPGIFGFVVYEGGKEYVGSTVHMCSYVISELLQKDAKPYLDQARTIQALHNIRVSKSRFYMIAAEGTTKEDAQSGNFRPAFIGQDGKAVCPVFGVKSVAENMVSKINQKLMLVEMNTSQMIDKLTEIQVNSGRDFPVLFAEASAPHVIVSSAFIGMVCDINRIAKPAVLTQPKAKPEVVTMDDAASEEEAPKIEVVAANDEPAQAEPSEDNE